MEGNDTIRRAKTTTVATTWSAGPTFTLLIRDFPVIENIFPPPCWQRDYRIFDAEFVW
jgi:hypothetical protein